MIRTGNSKPLFSFAGYDVAVGILDKSLSSMYASPVDHVHYLKVRDEGFSDSLKTTTLYVVGMGRCFKDKYGAGAENLKLEKHFASLYGIRTKSIEEKSRNAPSRGAHVEVPSLRPPRPRRQEQADDTTTRKNGFLKTCQCAAVSLAPKTGRQRRRSGDRQRAGRLQPPLRPIHSLWDSRGHHDL